VTEAGSEHTKAAKDHAKKAAEHTQAAMFAKMQAAKDGLSSHGEPSLSDKLGESWQGLKEKVGLSHPEPTLAEKLGDQWQGLKEKVGLAQPEPTLTEKLGESWQGLKEKVGLSHPEPTASEKLAGYAMGAKEGIKSYAQDTKEQMAGYAHMTKEQLDSYVSMLHKAMPTLSTDELRKLLPHLKSFSSDELKKLLPNLSSDDIKRLLHLSSSQPEQHSTRQSVMDSINSVLSKLHLRSDSQDETRREAHKALDSILDKVLSRSDVSGIQSVEAGAAEQGFLQSLKMKMGLSPQHEEVQDQPQGVYEHMKEKVKEHMPFHREEAKPEEIEQSQGFLQNLKTKLTGESKEAAKTAAEVAAAAKAAEKLGITGKLEEMKNKLLHRSQEDKVQEAADKVQEGLKTLKSAGAKTDL